MNAPEPLTQPSFRAEQADFSLPGSLLRTGRPAQRGTSLRLCPSSNSSLRFSALSASSLTSSLILILLKFYRGHQ